MHTRSNFFCFLKMSEQSPISNNFTYVPVCIKGDRNIVEEKQKRERERTGKDKNTKRKKQRKEGLFAALTFDAFERVRSFLYVSSYTEGSMNQQRPKTCFKLSNTFFYV